MEPLVVASSAYCSVNDAEPIVHRKTNHSARSAIIGSTRLARQAGIQQARKAIVRSITAIR